MPVATMCLRCRSLYMLTFTVNICGEDDMKYTIKTGLSSRVSFLNPSWNEDVDSAGVNDRFKVCIRSPSSTLVTAHNGLTRCRRLPWP